MAMDDSAGAKLSLGDTVPDFEASSTKGHLRFHRWLGSSWGMLFCQPQDFHPVFLSELAMLARLHSSFREKGFKIAVIGCANLEDQVAWEKDVLAHAGGNTRTLEFPLIADPAMDIMVKFGLVDATGGCMSSNVVLVVSPNKQLMGCMEYPEMVAQNLHELRRACAGLIVVSQRRVAIPASWPDNHANLQIAGHSMEGAVFVHPEITADTADNLFPHHVKIEVPSGLTYMRLTHLRSTSPPSCCAGILHCLPFRRALAQQDPEASLPRYSTPAMARFVQTGSGPKATVIQALPSACSALTRDAAEALRAAANRPHVDSKDGCLRLGDVVPDFEAHSTKGRMVFHNWIKDRWALLLAHPAAFTPVCTTEIGTVAMMYRSLQRKGFRVAAIAPNDLLDQIRWERDILVHFEHKIKIDFPLVADPGRRILARMGIANRSRSVFIIGPDRRLKLAMHQTSTVGFDVHEVVRLCDALQLSMREGVAIPAAWPNNHPEVRDKRGASLEGSVLLLPGLQAAEASTLFPDSVELELPSGRHYMRLTNLSKEGKMPVCANCVASYNNVSADPAG